jgi:hypothetical protein
VGDFAYLMLDVYMSALSSYEYHLLALALINTEEEFNYSLRTDYSGRGMFGDTCIGIVCGNTSILLVHLTMWLTNAHRDNVNNEYGIESLIDAVSGCKTDSVGYDNILYFPQIKWDNFSTEDREALSLRFHQD